MFSLNHSVMKKDFPFSHSALCHYQAHREALCAYIPHNLTFHLLVKRLEDKELGASRFSKNLDFPWGCAARGTYWLVSFILP